MKVSYDPRSHELNIRLPFDPNTVRSKSHRLVTRDFSSRPVPRGAHRRPSPLTECGLGVAQDHAGELGYQSLTGIRRFLEIFVDAIASPLSQFGQK